MSEITAEFLAYFYGLSWWCFGTYSNGPDETISRQGDTFVQWELIVGFVCVCGGEGGGGGWK